MASAIEIIEAMEMDAVARAKSALARSSIYVLREIQVDQAEGVLTLQGRVDTFYHKQLAQEIVRGVVDGMRVENELTVD